MKVLVVNCGSSSVKYRLFDGSSTVTRGLIERVTDYAAALAGILPDLSADAVGHRVVHGGTRFSAPVLVTPSVVSAVRELIPMAPLHNPANLAGIEAVQRLLPDVPQVAVFDTAFHRTIPPSRATYAIDAAVAQRYGIRQYGFHGTSHAYVSRRTAELTGGSRIITLHLGNGASACAIADGVSVATSMGLSPLGGLVMGTRPGDIDPYLPIHLMRSAGLSLDEVDELLNHHSGLLGICGANDMRDVLSRRAASDPSACLAFDVYCTRIRATVGAYYALLGRVDAICFTAGVGENAAEIRASSLEGLTGMGISVDPALNAAPLRAERMISPPGSPVAVCVVPTEEELEIATQTQAVLESQPS
jgi:acetate kinase